MTKAEVIAQIGKKTGIDKGDVESILETYFQVIKQSLAKGEPVYVRGFGSFELKNRAQKIARNIKQNTAVVVEAHVVPTFKPAKEFIHQVRHSKALE